MIAHPTHILRTTRSGKRDPVHRLNQPVCWDKLEPSRRSACVCARARIGEPAAKGRVRIALWTDASLLLVILHYLLKNNTAFMMGMKQVKTPPEAQGKRSAGISRVAPVSHRGRWGV